MSESVYYELCVVLWTCDLRRQWSLLSTGDETDQFALVQAEGLSKPGEVGRCRPDRYGSGTSLSSLS